MRTRVLIVDDHEAFRAAARAVLERCGFDVVGEHDRGDGVVGCVRDLRPDLVLLDIQLPDVNGFAVAEELATLGASPAVVLVSTRDAGDYGRRVERAPVAGFLTKSQLTGAAVRALLEAS